MAIRNVIVHGKAPATESEFLRAVDLGLTIYRAIRAVPVERHEVEQVDIPLYEDAEGRTVDATVTGVMLRSNSPGGTSSELRIFPTTQRHFRVGIASRLGMGRRPDMVGAVVSRPHEWGIAPGMGRLGRVRWPGSRDAVRSRGDFPNVEATSRTQAKSSRPTASLAFVQSAVRCLPEPLGAGRRVPSAGEDGELLACRQLPLTSTSGVSRVGVRRRSPRRCRRRTRRSTAGRGKAGGPLQAATR